MAWSKAALKVPDLTVMVRPCLQHCSDGTDSVLESFAPGFESVFACYVALFFVLLGCLFSYVLAALAHGVECSGSELTDNDASF